MLKCPINENIMYATNVNKNTTQVIISMFLVPNLHQLMDISDKSFITIFDISYSRLSFRSRFTSYRKRVSCNLIQHEGMIIPKKGQVC